MLLIILISQFFLTLHAYKVNDPESDQNSTLHTPGTTAGQIQNKLIANKSESTIDQLLITEGGKVPLKPSNVSVNSEGKHELANTTHDGREQQVTLKPNILPTSSITHGEEKHDTPIKPNIPPTVSDVVYAGREGETVNKQTNVSVPSLVSTVKINETVVKKGDSRNITLYSDVSEKNDGTKTVARKGVDLKQYDNNSTSAVVSSTLSTPKLNAVSSKITSIPAATIVPVPKKPNITVGADESHKLLYSKSKLNVSNAESLTKMPINTNNERQKYIVPIVAVILSVPFVAILLSLVYKRSSDWWRYRHYRRMDFLINGMYD